MAEAFSASLVASGLTRYPSSQTFTYINGGVSSALDYWLTSANVVVASVNSSGSTIAQHGPLRATFSVDLLEGTWLLQLVPLLVPLGYHILILSFLTFRPMAAHGNVFVFTDSD